MNSSKRLKRAREYLGLTQQELGEKLGFEWHKIKNIETEKHKLTTEIAENIEQYYSISGWWLLTGKGEMLQNNESKIFIPNKLNSNISDKEIEILDAYRKLNQKKQKLYYHQILAAAAQAEIEADETNGNLVKDVKSAV